MGGATDGACMLDQPTKVYFLEKVLYNAIA